MEKCPILMAALLTRTGMPFTLPMEAEEETTNCIKKRCAWWVSHNQHGGVCAFNPWAKGAWPRNAPTNLKVKEVKPER